MKILALTGSIGVGKTTIAKRLLRMGIPCFDADAEIHSLLGPGGAAVQPLLALFCETIPDLQDRDGGLKRSVLAHYLTQNPDDFADIEEILHPLVYCAQRSFLSRQFRLRRPVVALDVPLLLEKGWDQYCDMIVVLTTPDFLRRKRVLSRYGMTKDHLAVIESRQWSCACKCLQADRVIPTGVGFRLSMMLLRRAVRILRASHKKTWAKHRVMRRFNPVKGKWMIKNT